MQAGEHNKRDEPTQVPAARCEPRHWPHRGRHGQAEQDQGHCDVRVWICSSACGPEQAISDIIARSLSAQTPTVEGAPAT